MPIAPTSDEAREHNQNLPGMGGVFNTLNLAVYHYGANNPLKYVDPDGREVVFINGGGPRGENPTAMNGYIRAFWGTSNRQDYGRLTFPVFDHLGGPLNNRVNPENVGFLNGSFGDQNPDGIVGWSMGADTAAQFLLQTEKSDFGFIVLDGGLPLSTDEIRNIANKTDSLTIIFHENDLLGKRDYGNLGAKALQEYVDLASELDNFSFIGVPRGHHPAPEAAFPPVKDIE